MPTIYRITQPIGIARIYFIIYLIHSSFSACMKHNNLKLNGVMSFYSNKCAVSKIVFSVSLLALHSSIPYELHAMFCIWMKVKECTMCYMLHIISSIPLHSSLSSISFDKNIQPKNVNIFRATREQSVFVFVIFHLM